jgi:hypothetical protein
MMMSDQYRTAPRWMRVPHLVLAVAIAMLLTAAPVQAQNVPVRDAQGVLLEAVRQDMLRQRLNELVSGVDNLIRDLKSNALLDLQSENELDRLSRRIETVSERRVQQAAEALREAAAADDPDQPLTVAEYQIDLAAREIGSIMIRLGVRYATEVFGRELHELVVAQSDLYLRTLELRRQAEANTEPLWEPQSRIGDHTVQLLAEMSEVDNYASDALAMVRLSRVVAKLQATDVEPTLHEAANDLRDSAIDAAMSKQRHALDALMKAEFRVRPGAELRALVETRDHLRAIRGEQRNLRDAVSRWDRQTFEQRGSEARLEQLSLRQRIERIIPPPILDEKLQLADEVLQATGLETAMSDVEPIEPFLEEAGSHMTEAAARIVAAEVEAAGEAQLQAEVSIDKAIKILQLRIDAAMHLDAVFRRLQDAIQRLKEINDLIDHQTELKEEAQQAEAEGGASRFLAMPQDNLSVEVESFKSRIVRENQELEAPSDYVPLVGRELDNARRHMLDAAVSLKDDRPADAVPIQERALVALRQARDVAEQEVDLLERLWQLLQAVKDLEAFQQYLSDMEIEQRELRVRTDESGTDTHHASELAVSQQRLVAASEQVRGILDPGQVNLSRLGKMLEDTTAEMTAAEQHMMGGQLPPAVPRQEQAEQRLREAQLEVKRLAEQMDYLAEWLEFLKELNADALDLLQRQIILRHETELAEIAAFDELAGEQEILRTEATSFAQLFPVGQADYARAADYMKHAVAALKEDDRTEALKQMALAEDALSRAIEQLMLAMEALDQVPMLSLMDKPPEELLVLTRIMLLASRERTLRQRTRAIPNDEGVVRFVNPQQELLDEARDIATVAESEMPLLTEAEHEMVKARDQLEYPSRDQAVRHMQLAEKHLRQLLLELALEFAELPKQLEQKRAMSVISLLPPTITMESEHAFAKEAVEGEMSASGRTEWRILGQRDRAALKQNFARELPLEYRDLLRVYFERLSE